MLATLVLLLSGELEAQAPHVVIVSLDGFAASRLEDEELELPTLRGMARSGVWAESSESVYPSTDHPAHTSITTGVPPRVHGVLGNRMVNRETGEYFHVTNKPRGESIRVETLFDAAKKKGLRTAAFFWPETRDDPSVDVGIPPVLTGDGKADISSADPAFLEELRTNGVPIDLFFQWYDDAALEVSADRILTRAAGYVLERYRPNLLLLRLRATDRQQHRYGPSHYLAKAALTAADYNVGLLRASIEHAGLKDQTTLFVVSDHGFHTVEYSVNVYPLFARSGLAEKVQLHPGYWSVVVELAPGFDTSRDGAALERTLEEAEALEGVRRVFGPEDVEALGLPRYEEDPHVLGQYIILGDIGTRLVVEEGSDSTRRARLSQPFYGHGYLPNHEAMYPLLLATGRGVKGGARIGHVSNYDIAPTVGVLLGLEMRGLVGRVLDEMLRRASP